MPNQERRECNDNCYCCEYRGRSLTPLRPPGIYSNIARTCEQWSRHHASEGSIQFLAAAYCAQSQIQLWLASGDERVFELEPRRALFHQAKHSSILFSTLSTFLSRYSQRYANVSDSSSPFCLSYSSLFFLPSSFLPSRENLFKHAPPNLHRHMQPETFTFLRRREESFKRRREQKRYTLVQFRVLRKYEPQSEHTKRTTLSQAWRVLYCINKILFPRL